MENQNKLYHFVGIKGSGMSSLALVLHEQGLNVQGSDIEKYFFTQRDLEKANIKILPFNADNVKPGMTIIAGNAFPDTPPGCLCPGRSGGYHRAGNLRTRRCECRNRQRCTRPHPRRCKSRCTPCRSSPIP